MKISDILQFPARPRTLPAPAGFGAYAALLSRAFVPCLFFDIMMYADRSVVHFSTLHLCLYLLWFGVLPAGGMLLRRFGRKTWPGSLGLTLTAAFVLFCIFLYEAGLYNRLRRIVLFQVNAVLYAAILVILYLLFQLLWGRSEAAHERKR